MSVEFPFVKLADLCESIDYGHTASAAEDPVGPRFLRITDIVSGHINWSSVPFVKIDDGAARRVRLHHGDIVIARTGATTGASAWISHPPEAVFASYLVRLRIKRGVDSRYIAYFLKAKPFWDYMRGVLGDKSAQPNASATTMTSVRVPVLPEEDQRALAAVLGTLDDKIELNRRMNETLEAMARALFASWFVDFDPVRAKSEGRAPVGMDAATAALFPDGFEESELGEVPHGWKAGTLGEIAGVVDCLHSKKPERQELGKPFIQLSNILDSGLMDLSDLFLVSDEDYALWTSKFEASPGDCVITNVGRVGAVAQVPAGFSGALGRNMTGLRCKPAWPYPTFLLEGLLSQAMRDEIGRKTDTGTILDALNVRNIPLLRRVLPPAAVAATFESVGRPVRARMEANHREALTLGELRDTLLPKLLSGELRVRDADRIVEQAV